MAVQSLPFNEVFLRILFHKVTFLCHTDNYDEEPTQPPSNLEHEVEISFLNLYKLEHSQQKFKRLLPTFL